MNLQEIKELQKLKDVHESLGCQISKMTRKEGNRMLRLETRYFYEVEKNSPSQVTTE